MRWAIAPLVILLLASPASAAPRDRARAAINERRVDAGCARLHETGQKLLTSAKAWSRKMADDGVLSHSILDPGRWSLVGEVIGVGPGWRSVVRALFESRPHRRILLDCRYDRIALGLYRDDSLWFTGRLYAV